MRKDLEDLLNLADPTRALRAESRPMSNVFWNGTSWQGRSEWGSLQWTEIHLPVGGQRSFNCTCQDKKRRGRQVGPCKHVVSLAQTALQHLWVLEQMGSSSPATA